MPGGGIISDNSLANDAPQGADSPCLHGSRWGGSPKPATWTGRIGALRKGRGLVEEEGLFPAK